MDRYVYIVMVRNAADHSLDGVFGEPVSYHRTAQGADAAIERYKEEDVREEERYHAFGGIGQFVYHIDAEILED